MQTITSVRKWLDEMTYIELLEASGFLDPELSRIIGFSCSVAAVSTIQDPLFLSVTNSHLPLILRRLTKETLEVLTCSV